MDSQSAGSLIWLVAVLGGVAAGALIVWLLLRGRGTEALVAAMEQGRSEVRIELAAASERLRAIEQERSQIRLQFDALRQQADEWRNALDQARDERAQLSERALRVPVLQQQLDETARQLAELQRHSADLRESSGRLNSQLAAELKAEREVLGALRNDLQAEKAQRERAEALVGKLNAELAELGTRFEAERGQSDEKLALLTNARESLTNQFKSLANDILEEKAKRFTEQNQTNIGQLLDPLRVKLQEFQGKVEQVYVQEGKDRSALAEQVRQLMELNQSLSQDAKNLTRALKGSSKAQGNWGELILERVLEASGLRKGEEYDVQESHMRDDGSRAQPDVVVHLPEDRHLVVDAKVSLTAYEDYASAEEEGERQVAIKRHLDSVRGHIKGLSERNYQALYGLKSLDFVLMFVPVEPAFMIAVTHDRELFMDAWQRNVLLVSPSTLLFVVRTVAHLWRQEAQNRNAQDIARRGAELYDKLVGFVEDLESLGNRLKQAQRDYDTAHGKLTGGRGNVIRQAEMLKQLGVKPSKALPAAMIEAAAEGDETPNAPIGAS
ncbi:DNA recombination protein RmuC [Aromatoleum diolicum]|uniref:DNA recombination protein RmuC n=2 Tax=Aromatoleum diolicum TaxID=75796 RepID=A0ABX1QFU3_9RHOO|nr:DNA recombination protein RmuC [Aromatoleum diolicum]